MPARHDDAHRPSLETRVYYAERTLEDHGERLEQVEDDQHTTATRVSVIEAKAAVWAIIFGTLSGGLVAAILKHL